MQNTLVLAILIIRVYDKLFKRADKCEKKTNKLKSRKKGKFSINDNKANSNSKNYNRTANTKMITMKSTKHIMFQNLTSKL